LRAELYAVQLALGKKKKGTKADEPVEGQLKGLWFYVKSVDATNPTPEQAALDKIQGPVEEVIRVVETLEQDAETYDKELRKQMKKLEALTHPLPAAAVKPAHAAKPVGVEDEVPMGGAKPAAAAS